METFWETKLTKTGRNAYNLFQNNFLLSCSHTIQHLNSLRDGDRMKATWDFLGKACSTLTNNRQRYFYLDLQHCFFVKLTHSKSNPHHSEAPRP